MLMPLTIHQRSRKAMVPDPSAVTAVHITRPFGAEARLAHNFAMHVVSTLDSVEGTDHFPSSATR